MKLYQLLDIQAGMTAIIGSGGKTSLLYQLASELRKQGHRVLLTTTTHIRRPNHLPCATDEGTAQALLGREGIVCVGSDIGEGKLTIPAFEGWQTMAEYVLVEADGSRGKPLKAHASHEPVIPPEAGQTVCVVGMSGFNAPIVQMVHRPEIFCRMTGASILDMASPAQVAQIIRKENLCTRIYLNQSDAQPENAWLEMARIFAEEVNLSVVAGSLVTKEWHIIK